MILKSEGDVSPTIPRGNYVLVCFIEPAQFTYPAELKARENKSLI